MLTNSKAKKRDKGIVDTTFLTHRPALFTFRKLQMPANHIASFEGQESMQTEKNDTARGGQ